MIQSSKIGTTILLLLFLACAPPALLLQPISPSLDGVTTPAYRDLTENDVEALFVRPYTGRGLLETSGTTAAMLYDLSYLEKRVGAKAGGSEALYAMNRKYIEEGISFKIAIWGDRMGDVDLSRWRFQVRDDEGRLFDPIRIETLGMPEFEKESMIDKKAVWRNMADATFPLQLAPPLQSVVLEISRDDERVQHHTWKFSWDHARAGK